MPLNIVRSDITRLSADAIVNTANPEAAVGPGVDRAVFEAAGFDELLAERRKIGRLEPGQAAATPAFALDAKYVIHTVGPLWEGGSAGEEQAVASCYRNSLSLARELGCASAAFPLISTGTLGFPKDRALKIAVDEISSFLMELPPEEDMDVTLAVYDRESFALSGKLFSGIRELIGDAETAEFEKRMEERAERRSRAEKRRPLKPRSGRPGNAKESEPPQYFSMMENVEEPSIAPVPVPPSRSSAPLAPSFGSAPAASSRSAAPAAPETAARSADGAGKPSLRELILGRRESFQQYLLRAIDRSGMTDPEVYKRANVDRKLFSKIRSNEDYQPSKRTAVAFAIALKLSEDETLDMLACAGLTLSGSSKFDIIIRYCLRNGIYDIHEINCILFDYEQALLGA
jgi:O-acetyl-ADP-ribose deacetylase (regulator of RNase III)